MPAGLVVHALTAFHGRLWVSGLGAVIVAALLAARHRRVRFAAYVFFSAVALRAVVADRWAVLAYAAAAILAMQTPGARAAWPRLVGGGAWRRRAST